MMPTIHVSKRVMEEIESRRKDDEPPTDVLERIINRDMSEVEDIVEKKIIELVVPEALE